MSDVAASLPAAQPPVPMVRRLPELLAPAGDWDCVKAAVENGADAVYFGLDRFNARMRARNFTEADLPRLMEFLHRRGVRGYVTFNTLVFTDELAEAGSFLRTLITAGVDAAIVQDVGICRLIRQLSRDFPIHASTQMTVTSAAGVEFARELGCELVVMARECSLRDLEAIQQALPAALPLEVFIHGALCVAYSGQCLTSESLGGRSANRGECAQACRLPYELVADGRTVPLGDRRYLLSPQDLAGLDLIPELARLGLRSLKIEGRLKSAEYVANITRLYRQALDALGPEFGAGPSPEGGSDSRPGVSPPTADPVRARYDMEMAFSRGLYTGWFGGIDNQELVHARFPNKRGVFLGRVTGVAGERVHLRLEAPLKPGDGVVFDAGRPDEPEEGGRVYELLEPPSRGERRPGVDGSAEVMLTFGRGDLNFRRVRVGDRVWKTSDPELERRLRQTYAGDAIRFQRPIDFEAHGAEGTPLTLVARDGEGHVATAVSALPLARATRQPMTPERLRSQLERLGGTPFKLCRVVSHLEGEVLLPVSELNRMRRDLVAELDRQRARPRRWQLRDVAGFPRISGSPESQVLGGAERIGSPAGAGFAEACLALDGATARASAELPAAARTPAALAEPELVVLVRSLPQLEAVLAAGVATIYCELEDPKRYRDAVGLARQSRVALGVGTAAESLAAVSRVPSLFVAPPRITKPGEGWILKQVRSAEADGYLVRNPDHLEAFAGCRCVGDFSLNVANPWSAAWFMERFRLERVTASYDLNNAQLDALLRAAPPAWFEITIHQHMPMFHMEHCVFCAFLTTGHDYRDCGRPCDVRDLRLRDRVGALHPVKADAGCRNTVYNALAQTGAEYVQRLLTLGARHFRLEFLDESPEVVTRTLTRYRQLLCGEITGAQLWRELRLRHQLGVTRGSLDRGERPITVL
jgi:putative protease